MRSCDPQPDWEKQRSGAQLCKGPAPLGIMGGQFIPRWKPLDHQNTIVLKGLRGALYWAPFMSRESAYRWLGNNMAVSRLWSVPFGGDSEWFMILFGSLTNKNSYLHELISISARELTILYLFSLRLIWDSGSIYIYICFFIMIIKFYISWLQRPATNIFNGNITVFLVLGGNRLSTRLSNKWIGPLELLHIC